MKYIMIQGRIVNKLIPIWLVKLLGNKILLISEGIHFFFILLNLDSILLSFKFTLSFLNSQFLLKFLQESFLLKDIWFTFSNLEAH